MASPSDAPARERAAVELIAAALDEDHPALAIMIFESYNPEERDRIAAAIRTRILRAVRVARTRRV